MNYFTHLKIIGDFKDAGIDVGNNNLTRFYESVFGPMLQQMTSGNGFISANEGSNMLFPHIFKKQKYFMCDIFRVNTIKNRFVATLLQIRSVFRHAKPSFPPNFLLSSLRVFAALSTRAK